MFSCCRCTNPSRKHSKSNKSSNDDDDDEDEQDYDNIDECSSDSNSKKNSNGIIIEEINEGQNTNDLNSLNKEEYIEKNNKLVVKQNEHQQNKQLESSEKQQEKQRKLSVESSESQKNSINTEIDIVIKEKQIKNCSGGGKTEETVENELILTQEDSKENEQNKEYPIRNESNEKNNENSNNIESEVIIKPQTEEKLKIKRKYQKSQIYNNVADQSEFEDDDDDDDDNDNDDEINLKENDRKIENPRSSKSPSKSETSNSTTEESIILNKVITNQIENETEKENSKSESSSSSNTKSSVPKNLPQCTQNILISSSSLPASVLLRNDSDDTEPPNVEDDDSDKGSSPNESDKGSSPNKSDKQLKNFNESSPNNSNDDRKSSGDTTITTFTTNGDLPKSCISRRSSSKSSLPKRVNINDSTEVIPSSDGMVSIADDDEVFSDSVPPKVPRGDMCVPYISKRGSISTHFGLPEWFNNEERFYNEQGGSMEPPVTPVGRDELALKRHRMYSELLIAAQAAVEHRVRFDPLGPDIATDYDQDLKPSTTIELENLLNRLEKLIERLERTVSARELDIANKTFDSVKETKRRSIDLQTSIELPPPSPPSLIANYTSTTNNSLPSNNRENFEKKSTDILDNSLEVRIERIESSLNHINNNYRRASQEDDNESSLNIPTAPDDLFIPEECQNNCHQQQIKSEESELKMSVVGYKKIIEGPLAQYIALSDRIGDDVAKQAQLVKAAFNAQLQYIIYATQYAQPPQSKQIELLKPTSDQITAIQDFREKNRTSTFFNHLSAISESIPALGWVCVTPTPGPHVKEMNDAGQFYTNRVLKEWKEKDVTHVEWARAWIQTLTDLQKYIRQYHTTGLVWSGKCNADEGTPPPSVFEYPPPPPVQGLADLLINNVTSNDDRGALFAEINQGERITKNLKKVTPDMQTHKNTTLRTGPAPFKSPLYSSSPVTNQRRADQQNDKSPIFTHDGKKWLIEYQNSNQDLFIENAEMNNVVYMFKCQDSTLTIKGKINSVVMDSCNKCSILFDSVVSSVEFVNCQRIQMQVFGKVPTISIDKTDGCQMYLSKDSLNVEIISSKSSEMNVLIPKDNGDYTEQPIPEQFKTIIKGKSLQTICVESFG